MKLPPVPGIVAIALGVFLLSGSVRAESDPPERLAHDRWVDPSARPSSESAVPAGEA